MGPLLISSHDQQQLDMIKFLLLISLLSLTNAGFLFGDSCVAVPNNLCAMVYDDEDCEGWKLDVPVGEMMFKWWDPTYFWYRNDIETVVVRAGCTFTGFDDSSLNGGSFTIRAGNSDRRVNLGDEDEYEDYDEKIQSLSCH